MSGAVALLKSRGKKQFQTQIGRELFVAVRATEVSNSHQLAKLCSYLT